MKPFVEWCQQQQLRLRTRLVPLETGQTRLSCRAPGGDWEDVTHEEIEQIRLRLKEVDDLFARIREEDPSARIRDDDPATRVRAGAEQRTADEAV